MVGRPFQKGQSGNPDGRPKLPDDIKAGCKRLALQGFARFEKALADPKTPLPMVYHITKLMAAYGYGTPVNTAVQNAEAGGVTVEIAHYHYEDEPPVDSDPTPPGSNLTPFPIGGRNGKG